MEWRTALVERAGELGALRDALAGAGSDGRVIALEGPAGIGKSRLLRQLQEEAAGFDVLSARGGVLERDIPFGVARQLLERRLTRASSTERHALLAGAAAPAAAILGLPSDDDVPVPAELARSLQALFWLILNLAEHQPVLLAVDDAQWADSASLEVLAYVARRLEGVPVLLALAARDGEPWSHVGARAELLARATEVRPSPLTGEGVGALLGRAFGAPGSPELVEACRAATAGNPFYVTELLRTIATAGRGPDDVSIEALLATVPSTVIRATLLRLGALGDDACRLAEAAAVLGDGASLREAAALAELPPDGVEETGDRLVEASILAELRPIQFAHPIVLAAIAGEIRPGRRGLLHRQAALILKAASAPVDRIVPHLLRAAPTGDQWMVSALRKAAFEASSRGVPEVAVRCLRRALEEPPASDRAGLLAQLGGAQVAAGLYADAAASAQEAIDAGAGPAERAPLRLLQATAVVSVQGGPAALACLEQGIVEAREADPDLALALEGELGFQALLAGAPHPVFSTLDRHRSLPGDTHGERFVLALLAMDAVRSAEPAAVVRDLALRALAHGRLVAEQSVTSGAYFIATVALLAAEAYEDAALAIAAGEEECRTRGLAYGYGGVCWMRGLLALARGDLAAAEADERECIEHAVPTMVGIGVASLALALLEQGDVAGAEEELAGGGLLGDDRPVYVWGPYVRALVRLAQGRPQEALVDLSDVGRHAEEPGGFPASLPWRAHKAVALQALDDLPGARRVADEELVRARRHGGARAVAGALRATGLVSNGESRLAHLREAVALLEGSAARLDLAKVRVDLGVALLRAGRRREGREALERAYDGARACGARGLAQAAYDELLVAGARPRRLTFTGRDALTASERRVAAMAAEGMTNRDIAQVLFVTPKTVENQLGRVYGKLGVNSRRALREALDQPQV